MKILEDGNLHEFEELTPDKRPQDRPRGGSRLMFTTLEHGGEHPDTMPQALKVADRQRRSLTYVPKQTPEGKVAGPNGRPLAANRRPQDEAMDGRDLAFTPTAWGAEYADDMPEQIAVTDREGRSCIYEPIRVNGHAVDSKGFTLIPAGEQLPERHAAE